LEKEIEKPPPRGYLLTRIGLSLFGALTLLWLPVEGSNPIGAQLLAGFLCLLAGLNVFYRPGSRQIGRFRMTAGGLLAGLGTPPLAALILVFKNGLHSHSSPDFPPTILFAVLVQTPIWGLAGALIAAGLHPILVRK
jgi:hypothetical protein